MNHAEHAELTAAAIARLAGVGRAAVSNWRSRYPDFPKPAGGTAASPTFARAEVEAWLTATGKADQLATAGRTETGTQRIGLPELGTQGSGPHRNGAALASPDVVTADRSIADLTPGELLAKVMASLLPRSTFATRSADVAETDPPVVLDPACSRGSLLMAVADRFGDQVKLAGQEILESAAAMAALNLRGHGQGAAYEIRTGDSLLDDQFSAYLGSAAAVICEPPANQARWSAAELATDPRWEFGTPAPRDAELAWVQHCYAHLRPRGVAVVAVSSRTCFQSSGQHIRAALVRSGVLRDVIGLPSGLGSEPGTDVYLWVLQRPYGTSAPAAVRMIELSSLPAAADVPHDFAAWQRLLDDADPSICRAVPRLQLLDGDVSLLPSRYVSSRVNVSAADLSGVTSRLQTLYARAGQSLPSFEAPARPVRHSYVTLGELERAGALTIRSRESTPLRGDLLLRTFGRPPVVAAGTPDDDDGKAQVVELDRNRLDGHFVAMFLRTDVSALPTANTLGALSKDDLRRFRIPRMALADQRRYGEVFRHLQEVDDALAALAKVSANVIDQTVHGLITGALAPDFPL